LKRACSLGVTQACNDVNQLLEQTPTPPPAAPPPPAPPPQPATPEPPHGPRERTDVPWQDDLRDDQDWTGSRFGVVGRLAAGPTLLTDRSAGASVAIGTGARYSLRERRNRESTFAPAVALMIDGQFGGEGSYTFGTLGLEARFEFVAVSAGGLLMPFFNCWLSAGVNTWFDSSGAVAPSAWFGTGFGWNLFAHRDTWPRTSLGFSASGGPAGLLASAIAAAIVGVLHSEIRVEQIVNGQTALHVLIGIGL
jgi:hypothetical protein